jgi:hypothetical protein
VRRDDDDELPGEGRPPGGEPDWLEQVVVPDDISSLEADIRALHRERRARARRRMLRRVLPLHRLSAPIVIVVLIVASGITGLVVLFNPRRPGVGTTGSAAPLATPGAQVGQVRGLVPDVTLTLADGSRQPVRDYRPAVLALVPTGCACDEAVRESSTAAARHRVVFVLVDPAVRPTGTTPADRGTGLRGTDPSGTLARAYGSATPAAHAAGSPVLVLVAADGRVSRVLREAADRRTLDGELSLLELSASPSS